MLRLRLVEEDRSLIIASARATLLCIVLLSLTASLALAQSFQTIHTFNGVPDGELPVAGLTADQAGNLYGTASGGGLNQYAGGGTVFELTNSPSGWTLRVLTYFQHESSGVFPFAPVTFGPGGSLYGTTSAGYYGYCNPGSWYQGCGTAFSLEQSDDGTWSDVMLHAFSWGSWGSLDGAVPEFGALLFDQSGRAFGTTLFGGKYNRGTVFEMQSQPHQSGNWMESLPWSFGNGSDSALPAGGLIADAAGNLYGTASAGGANNCGTIFELTPPPPGSIAWSEEILYSFDAWQTGTSGCSPLSALLADADGNLYGTTSVGGVYGGGTVFELSSRNGDWSFQVLHSFVGREQSFSKWYPGRGPQANLVADAEGNLYGSTLYEGAFGAGNIFKLTRSRGWAYTDLHDFNMTDGSGVGGALYINSSGDIFGTTEHGGSSNLGTVFEITQ